MWNTVLDITFITLEEINVSPKLLHCIKPNTHGSIGQHALFIFL